ncbi:hypothetical protein [Rhizobium sp. CIAT894]|uniref:hypothetical protein n=1 Tax=Rhizobium sp. CIAT894 TaxID=2020312 RepID=UPI000A1DC502|nr:hypothetical protein [Rhizobium sp. CIAT894]
MKLPSKKDARLCAGVVREVARAKGITEPYSIGRLTVSVARLFNKGTRERENLLSEAMAVADIPVAHEEQGGALNALRNMNPGTIDSSMEPENERGHQQL